MKLPSVLELLVASLVLAAANKLSPAAEAIDAVGDATFPNGIDGVHSYSGPSQQGVGHFKEDVSELIERSSGPSPAGEGHFKEDVSELIERSSGPSTAGEGYFIDEE